MTPRAIIGGVDRHLGAWRPARAKLCGVRPQVEITALREEHTIAGVPTDYDQGQLGSCGPNSLAEVYEYRLGGKWSRLWAYFFTRAGEGDMLVDDGVTIADLMDVACAIGLPPEALWPYVPAQFATPPPVEVFPAAAQHKVLEQDVVVDLPHLLHELDRDQPVNFGFRVPRSMQDGAGDTATTGIVRVPSAADPEIGGHAVTAIGFSRPRGMVRATCHYGPRYGDGGTIWLPFAHFTGGNATDMRAIRRIA